MVEVAVLQYKYYILQSILQSILPVSMISYHMVEVAVMLFAAQTKAPPHVTCTKRRREEEKKKPSLIYEHMTIE